MQSQPPGMLIVLSGPSGVGKDTLLDRLLTEGSLATGTTVLRRCVTATTRAPRPGEEDGVDYHFWSQAEFQMHVQQESLLEWARVHEHQYGTPRAWVEQRRAAGEDIILKIDVQGGLNVKERCPDTVMIFLLPPSLRELEQRLRQRLTDSEHQIEERLKTARFELGKARLYDYLVINDNLETAVAQVGSIICAERCRTARQAPRSANLWEEIERG